MAVKTLFTKVDIQHMLGEYEIGELVDCYPAANGSVETNYILQTTSGKYVLRYYEARNSGQVLFELQLLEELIKAKFPCAPYIPPCTHKICFYKQKPYVIFAFIEGEHIEEPNDEQIKELINLIATLGGITQNLQLSYAKSRLSYTPHNLKELVKECAEKANTKNGYRKSKWMMEQIQLLELPETLTMAVCHCDYYYTNVIYDENKIKALIDFDDANYTYLYFDIISVINFFVQGFDHETWRCYNQEQLILDFNRAKQYLKIFEQTSSIPQVDQEHFFDILKLGILIDCVWYFERGDCEDFFEKRKIDALNKIGRKQFYDTLFR